MREDDLVSRRGGLILVVFGVVLTAVAVARADQSTLAAIFAFGGIAAVVIGVLLGRMEGDFELSATSVKARLAAVTDVVQREELTLEDKGEQVVQGNAYYVDTDLSQGVPDWVEFDLGGAHQSVHVPLPDDAATTRCDSGTAGP